jgi:hypothetical protein
MRKCLLKFDLFAIAAATLSTFLISGDRNFNFSLKIIPLDSHHSWVIVSAIAFMMTEVGTLNGKC